MRFSQDFGSVPVVSVTPRFKRFSCKFCNASVFPECFPEALKRLKNRAKLAYTATSGKYVEGSESPILDAIVFPE